jgi:murein endopeptidase
VIILNIFKKVVFFALASAFAIGGTSLTGSINKASAKEKTTTQVQSSSVNTPSIYLPPVHSFNVLSPNLTISPNYIPAPPGTVQVIKMTNYYLGHTEIPKMETLSVSAQTKNVLTFFVGFWNKPAGGTIYLLILLNVETVSNGWNQMRQNKKETLIN